MEGDLLAVYVKAVLAALDSPFVCAMHRVILEHVCCVLGVAEWVVDGYNLDIRVLHRSTQDQPADPSESIDADLDLRTLNHSDLFVMQKVFKRVRQRCLLQNELAGTSG